jgi:hypothetical protein
MIVKAYLGLGSRSPYLAALQIGRIARECGARFEWIQWISTELIRRSRRSASPLESDVLDGAYAPAHSVSRASWPGMNSKGAMTGGLYWNATFTAFGADQTPECSRWTALAEGRCHFATTSSWHTL